jgi:beta-carotene 3-hydroxylase
VSWNNALIAIAAFVLMEPITAATHRWVMHGIGEFIHRSHHRPRRTRWETNDWYPVLFAGIVNIGFAAGFNLNGFGVLIPVGIGVTAYGAAYALVHDVYIHRRLGWFANRRIEAFERLADAHRIHHLYNAAPYGMLAPIVPADLRARAARTDRDPLASQPLAKL